MFLLGAIQGKCNLVMNLLYLKYSVLEDEHLGAWEHLCELALFLFSKLLFLPVILGLNWVSYMLIL